MEIKERMILPVSPFIRWFDYGQNNEGYWNYDHTVLQFEDVIDVLKVLYEDKFEYVFYFDHSSGHDCLCLVPRCGSSDFRLFNRQKSRETQKSRVCICHVISGSAQPFAAKNRSIQS